MVTLQLHGAVLLILLLSVQVNHLSVQQHQVKVLSMFTEEQVRFFLHPLTENSQQMHLENSFQKWLNKRNLHKNLVRFTSYEDSLFYIVPVTVIITSPGFVTHTPVTGFCVNVAAGTVISPGTVANSPVVSS